MQQRLLARLCNTLQRTTTHTPDLNAMTAASEALQQTATHCNTFTGHRCNNGGQRFFHTLCFLRIIIIIVIIIFLHSFLSISFTFCEPLLFSVFLSHHFRPFISLQTLCLLCINIIIITPYHHTLSSQPTITPLHHTYYHTLSSHPIITTYHHTLSSHPISHLTLYLQTPHHHAHLSISLYHHTLSSHPISHL